MNAVVTPERCAMEAPRRIETELGKETRPHLDGFRCSDSLGGDGHAPSQEEGKDGSSPGDLGGDVGRRRPNWG